jgi:putative membrane protein
MGPRGPPSDNLEIVMLKHLVLAGAAATALLTGAALAQDTPAAPAAPAADSAMSADAQPPASPDAIQPDTVTDPQQFADKATIANMFEIQSSQLALKQSSRDDIKAFAQSMIDDHTKAAGDMKTAASAQQVNLPTDLDQAHADMLKKLQAASGDAFDQLYVKMQTDGHVQAVALFKGYAQNGQDGVLKDFAGKLLPTLEHHYEMVLQLQQS